MREREGGRGEKALITWARKPATATGRLVSVNRPDSILSNCS